MCSSSSSPWQDKNGKVDESDATEVIPLRPQSRGEDFAISSQQENKQTD